MRNLLGVGAALLFALACSGGGGGGGGGGGQVRLTVVQRNLGGGAGSLTASIAGLDCDADGCTRAVLVPVGSSVTITATPSEGSEVGLAGGCDPVSGPCTVRLDQDRTVQATFTATNLMFVTSKEYTGELGGLSGADAACNQMATAAGLPGTYVAWLSTSSTGAASRLGTARGWIRTDGAPVADSVVSLTQNLQLFYPPRLDENGDVVAGGRVHTNTTPQGSNSAESDCRGWTAATTGYHVLGDANHGSGGWTESASTTCDAPAHLYCFGTDLQRAVAPEPTTGRLAFVTTAAMKGDFGLVEADALCASEASSAGLSQTFGALLAPVGASAVSRATLPDGPWVRPDGLVVAATTADLLGSSLRAPIAQTADGFYLEVVRVWVGATSPTAPGAAGTTCSGWTATTGTGDVGLSSAAGFEYFGSEELDCTQYGHLYCLER